MVCGTAALGLKALYRYALAEGSLFQVGYKFKKYLVH